MAKLNAYQITGVYANTTDNTTTTLAAFQTRSNKGYQVVAKITAVNTDTFAEVASYYLRAVFYNAAGTLTQESTTQSIAAAIETAALGAATATLDASGTEIRARVAGVTSKNLTWNIEAEIQEVGAWIANGGIL